MRGILNKVFEPKLSAERKALDFSPGDTLKVWQKIEEEKGKYRLQAFEGLVIARKHGTEPGATFIVRKITSGVGVEKIFPLYSPLIEKIDVIRRSKVRRAKLYYIREKSVKDIRRKMKDLGAFVAAKMEAPRVIAPIDVSEPAVTEEEKPIEQTLK